MACIDSTHLALSMWHLTDPVWSNAHTVSTSVEHCSLNCCPLQFDCLLPLPGTVTKFGAQTCIGCMINRFHPVPFRFILAFCSKRLPEPRNRPTPEAPCEMVPLQLKFSLTSQKKMTTCVFWTLLALDNVWFKLPWANCTWLQFIWWVSWWISDWGWTFGHQVQAHQELVPTAFCAPSLLGSARSTCFLNNWSTANSTVLYQADILSFSPHL